MRQSAKLVAGWAVVVAVFAHVTALFNGFVVAQEPRSPAVRSALGKIFTEDHVANSAYSVCERAEQLPARYLLPFLDDEE